MSNNICINFYIHIADIIKDKNSAGAVNYCLHEAKCPLQYIFDNYRIVYVA